MTGPLTVSDAAVRGILVDVRRYGAASAETGGFLLSRSAEPSQLAALALAGTAGVRRARGLFEVDGSAIERLFTWASDEGYRVHAQVHSHRRRAFLSQIDLRQGFTVEGFITAVVPNFANPPTDPDDWGWWHCQEGTWEAAAAPSVVPGAAEIVEFDADGVRGG